MPTTITDTVLRDRALAALATIDPATVASVRLRAVRIVRTSVKANTGRTPLSLVDIVDAVDWAIHQTANPTTA
jgi:hypothetical protein